MKNSLLKIVAVLGLSFAFAGVGKAITLDAATADALSGQPPPAWGSGWLYGFDGAEFGSQAANYSTTTGGDADTGYTWTVNFDIHPTLTYVKLHSGGPNQHNYLIWDDASDFAAFNASSDLSITFRQNSFINDNGKYYGISGLGLLGTPGDGHGNDNGGGVPDSTATVTLLGLALLGLRIFQRKFRA